jgi:hypothetical protein
MTTRAYRIVRGALWASVPYNLVGAASLAFPEALAGLAPLPPATPRFYAVQLALVVLLFAGVYAFLARSPVIDRPLLAVGALGKLAFFGGCAAFWLGGQAEALVPLAATGDLALALVFLGWLRSTAQRAAASHARKS